MTRTKIICQRNPMLVAGSAEQGFWVRGTGLRCNRYFSLSRFFEWDSKHAGIMHWAEVQMEDESIRRVPAVRLHREFWSEQAECTPEARSVTGCGGEGTGNQQDYRRHLAVSGR